MYKTCISDQNEVRKVKVTPGYSDFNVVRKTNKGLKGRLKKNKLAVKDS